MERVNYYDLDVVFEGAKTLPQDEEIIFPDYDEDGGFYDYEVQGCYQRKLQRDSVRIYRLGVGYRVYDESNHGFYAR